MSTSDGSRQPLNLIDGAMVPPALGSFAERTNPARPSEVAAVVPESSPEDVDAAVTAAHAAYRPWAALRPHQRAEHLLAAADLIDQRAPAIAADMVAEMGKPIREALPEVRRASAILRYFAGEAWRQDGTVYRQAAGPGRIIAVRRPMGVVGLITPWNFPVAIPAWKLIPAIFYGNTVVIKLSEYAAVSGTALLGAIQDAGLPPGVVNSVIGTGAAVGSSLVEHPRVAGISFTGSVPVGHAVRDLATPLGKPVQLELGGQNPLVVMDDADLDRAVEGAFAGAFWSAGQKCTSTRRILVQGSVHDEFRERLLARVDKGVTGDPTLPATEVGPLVNRRQWEQVSGRIAQAVADGCELVCGGVPEREGHFVEPTVFSGVPDDHFLAREEVFGPVTSLFPVDGLDEAIRRANDSTYGLAAGIYTGSLASADQFCREIEVGVAHVNSQTPGAEIHVPFGGSKQSAWGPHEQGSAAQEFFTNVMTIYEDA